MHHPLHSSYHVFQVLFTTRAVFTFSFNEKGGDDNVWKETCPKGILNGCVIVWVRICPGFYSDYCTTLCALGNLVAVFLNMDRFDL